MGTETLVNRKQTVFRLSEDLLNRLRAAAKRENQSLNNYVENILTDVVYRQPNQETLDAIQEAREGKFAGTIDMNDFDSFMKSINSIE
ncbi:MAG: toxin-antitoxin system HicB family antitoxin [Dysgonamonadaceae bacterium]|jgi:predicted HicB family RNase H-like nuclease|nr:toxin-antitoxin system HicB family antitoxin [Dysgonamonadaceae bacterium]